MKIGVGIGIGIDGGTDCDRDPDQVKACRLPGQTRVDEIPQVGEHGIDRDGLALALQCLTQGACGPNSIVASSAPGALKLT